MNDVTGPQPQSADEEYERLRLLTIEGDKAAAQRLYGLARRRGDMRERVVSLLGIHGPIEPGDVYGEAADGGYLAAYFEESEYPELMEVYQDLLSSGVIYANADKIGIPQGIPSMSPEKLKEFVMGVVDGRIFTDRHVRHPKDMTQVFMALNFMDPKALRVDDIGVIWEWMSEAGPRSINGMPMFMSFRMMNRSDAARAWKAIEREQKRREGFEV